MVERLMDRSTGYVPMHVLGLSKSAPHLVLRSPDLWAAPVARSPTARACGQAASDGNGARCEGTGRDPRTAARA
jgi:hypothetical protein